MLKFENNHIITGYIKQLLNSFNLPKCRVYTPNKPVLASTHFKLLTEDKTATERPAALSIAALNIPYKDTPANFIYLKDGKFAKYVGNAWEPVDFTGTTSADIYLYGAYIPNVTKNLRVKNNRYDSYTHEYLGDYLRFYRDYHGIDLMPLYNCFSNRVCSNLNLTFNRLETVVTVISDTETENSGNGSDEDNLQAEAQTAPLTRDVSEEVEENTKVKTKIEYVLRKYTFSDLDSNYKIYMLPVKLFQNYTIALSCPTQVEICCGFFGKQQSVFDAENKLPQLTYTRYSHLKFEQPILFQKLSASSLLSPTASNIVTDTNTDADASKWTKNGVDLRAQDVLNWAKNEVDLKMFIKLPANTKTSITVLEGDYVGWNDTHVRLYYTQEQTVGGQQITKQIDCFEKAYSSSVINFAPIDPKPKFEGKLERVENKLIFTGESNPGILLNIKNISGIPLRSPLQLLKVDTKVSYPFADRLVEYLFDNVVTPIDSFEDNIKRVQTFCSNIINDDKRRIYWPTFEGVWDNELKYLCYRWLTGPQGGKEFKRAEDSYYIHDLLGYVDKDAENHLTIDSNNTTITLESINLYPDCYNSKYTKN